MNPNNKSYISKEIKECIVQRKVAFKNGDILSMKNMQKELNQKIENCKEEGEGEM